MHALQKETEIVGGMYNKAVDSVFFGGGTPSFIDEAYIRQIMNTVRRDFKFAADAEVTLEANPCSLSREKVYAYRDAGINRLSIGLQAAQDSHLKTLGRQHNVAMFDNAFDLAREAGFENINIDMIYALPGQTVREWEETLFHALHKKPEHISAYALKIDCLLYTSYARIDQRCDGDRKIRTYPARFCGERLARAENAAYVHQRLCTTHRK